MSYESEVLSDSPRAYYRCSESSGQLRDLSGNANNTIQNNGGASYTFSQTSPIVTDPSDKAIFFNASSKSTAVGTASLDLGDVFTLEAWVKRTSTQGTFQGIVSKEVGAYLMAFNTSNGLQLTKSQIQDIVASTVSITDTTSWHHCVATKNGAVSSKLYIDGVDVTGTVTNATCTDNGTTPLNVGGNTTGLHFATAYIDEVAVYPTALSAARVLAHYNAGISSPGIALVPRRPGRRVFR